MASAHLAMVWLAPTATAGLLAKTGDAGAAFWVIMLAALGLPIVLSVGLLFWMYEVLLPRQGWRPVKVVNSAEALAHAYGPDALQQRGAAMVGRMGFNWPLGQIEVDATQATVRAGRVAVVRRQEVTAVEPIRFPGGTWGVRFASVDGRVDGVLFSPGFAAYSRNALAPFCQELARRDWPVVPL